MTNQPRHPAQDYLDQLKAEEAAKKVVPIEPGDFLEVVDSITNYVKNERVRAYNEGVDMMLGQVREWLRGHGHKPKGNYLPELLDEVAAAGASAR